MINSLIAGGVQLNVHKEQLDNGMTILLYENHQAPVVSCRLFYATGSVHESPGRSGLAHVLEHMLFKGTKKTGITDTLADAMYIRMQDSVRAQMKTQVSDTAQIKKLQATYDSLLTEHRKLFIKDELWETYLREGGSGLNAFTSSLMTAYIVTLPKNKVELYMWLESDRMQNAVLREFYPERDVVMEERRMRYDDSPTGRYREALRSTFYEVFPYRIPTIGYMSDLQNLSREQTEEHYNKYYKPNNAILVLAGDFKKEEVLPMIHRYFGPIPRGEDFAPITIQEPKQEFEKRLIQYKADARPQMDILFHTPGVMNKDLYALDILEGVLSGRTGRLYKRLVEEEQLAHSADAANQINKYTSSFALNIFLKNEADPSRVEAVIWEELNRLANEEISERELQKVKNQVYAYSVRALQDQEHVATQLAFFELYGDWQIINTFADAVHGVTREDVKAVVQKYFRPELSTTGMLLPPKPTKTQEVK
jgi:predicted Zn-dependent peptidase